MGIGSGGWFVHLRWITFPGPSARLPLLIRAIILRAIYLESIKSIRRQ